VWLIEQSPPAWAKESLVKIMSSFIGHSLTGFCIYVLEKKPTSNFYKKCWLIWLIIIACFPDIDYLFPNLLIISSQQQIVRTTHSFAISLILPVITIIFLLTRQNSHINTLSIRSRQAIIAGLSHLILDFLVAVMPLPLLYPFSVETFKSYIGILPSAGKISLTNYFFYRNLFIEQGILVPLFCSVYLIIRHSTKTRLEKVKIGCLLLISILFTFWSISLSRQ
jgi:inner membrane protein